MRRRVADLFRRALDLTSQAPGGEDVKSEESAAVSVANDVAERLEKSLYGLVGSLSVSYKQKARSLQFNLRQNEELRKRLLVGEQSVDEVTRMEAWDLAKQELKDARQQSRDQYYKEEVVSINDPGLGRKMMAIADQEDSHTYADKELAQMSLVPALLRSASSCPAIGADGIPLALNDQVRLTGLQASTAFNGRPAVFERWDPVRNRCEVRLVDGQDGGRLRSVKPANLMRAREPKSMKTKRSTC